MLFYRIRAENQEVLKYTPNSLAGRGEVQGAHLTPRVPRKVVLFLLFYGTKEPVCQRSEGSPSEEGVKHRSLCLFSRWLPVAFTRLPSIGLAWLFPAPGPALRPHHVWTAQQGLQARRRTQLREDMRWKEQSRQTK